jgi:hypothetical protein
MTSTALSNPIFLGLIGSSHLAPARAILSLIAFLAAENILRRRARSRPAPDLFIYAIILSLLP